MVTTPSYVRRGTKENRILEHRRIVENILGKRLPTEAQVHHVDENGKNNAHTNLVVCPSQAYHKLLHRRQRALDACGNANWLKCSFCKKWGDPQNLDVYEFVNKGIQKRIVMHLDCRREKLRKQDKNYRQKIPAKQLRIAQEIRERIRDDFLLGYRYDELAERFGVNQTTIHRVRREFGLTRILERGKRRPRHV